MQNAETLNPEQISEFLKLGEAISFAGQSGGEKYAWAQRLLVAREYACQGKKERGMIRAYLSKVTGLSVPQTARLIQMYRETGVVELKPSLRHEFRRTYTDADVALLAELDRAHERMSGPDPMHFAAGVRAVRQAGVCAVGGDLGGASVQPTQQRELLKTGGGGGMEGAWLGGLSVTVLGRI